MSNIRSKKVTMSSTQIKVLKKELKVMLGEQEAWSVHVPIAYRVHHTTIMKQMLVRLSTCSVKALM